MKEKENDNSFLKQQLIEMEVTNEAECETMLKIKKEKHELQKSVSKTEKASSHT